jgi:cysteine synthase
MKHKGTLTKIGLAVAAGAAMGYVASLFVPEKTRRQHKQQLTDKTSQLKQLLTDPEQHAKLKAAFQKNYDQAAQVYSDVKTATIKNLSQLSGTIKDIDKKKYTKALEQALQIVKTDKKLPAKELAKIKQFLLDDYQLIANQPQTNGRAASKVTSTLKKTPKVKKTAAKKSTSSKSA